MHTDAGANHRDSNKRGADSYSLLQSEYGDIYKVTLEYKEETVAELRVKYFDSLPACSSICVLKTGFLFAASEFGNHSLYQFAVRPALFAINLISDSCSCCRCHCCSS